MAVRKITVRRGTASSWTSANPTLSSGEFGYETDTGKMKIGTGTTPWTSLSYFSTGAGGGASELDDLTDVDTSGLQSGDVLEWDGSNWIASDSVRTFGTTSLTDYYNPLFGPPQNGDILVYNSTNFKWEPKQPTTGVSTSSTPHPFAMLV